MQSRRVWPGGRNDGNNGEMLVCPWQYRRNIIVLL